MNIMNIPQILQGPYDRTLTIKFAPGWWVLPSVLLGLGGWYFIIKSLLNLFL